MPIALEDDVKPGLPVVKRTALGEVYIGAVVRTEQRDRLKKDDATGMMAPILKPNGKAAQELVVTCLTLPGTTSLVGLGDDQHAATETELVRVILKGKAFGDWIESKRDLGRPVQVGDVLTQTTEHAQAYDAQGNPVGNQIVDQATLNALPRGRSVGIYGTLTVRAPQVGSPWIARAESAYHAAQAAPTGIAAETASVGGFSDDEPPF